MATISTTTTSTLVTTKDTMAMPMERRKSYHDLCRLCASYDNVSMHIFGQEGRNRQLVDKIQTCLPFKRFVALHDSSSISFFRDEREKEREREKQTDGEKERDSRTTRSASTGRYWVKVSFPPPPSSPSAIAFPRSPSSVLGDEFHPVAIAYRGR